MERSAYSYFLPGTFLDISSLLLSIFSVINGLINLLLSKRNILEIFSVIDHSHTIFDCNDLEKA